MAVVWAYQTGYAWGLAAGPGEFGPMEYDPTNSYEAEFLRGFAMPSMNGPVGARLTA